MANGHGGKRTPRNPAPVSAPGRLSRRTDGGPVQTNAQMTGMGYGENADFMDIQSSAPMAAAPSVPNARTGRSAPTGQAAAATPLFAPTQRPNEPVTAGAPVGPGPSPAAPVNGPLADAFRRMAMNDDSGDAFELFEIAQRLGY